MSGSSAPNVRALAGALAIAVVVMACGHTGRQQQRPPPEILRARNTPTPVATQEPYPTPVCSSPPAKVVKYSIQEIPNAKARLVMGEVHSECTSVIDLTMSVRWLDGPSRGAAPFRFLTLRRLQPGETRPFKETAIGGDGATTAEFLYEVEVSRRR